MADRATADRVAADMKPPNYRGAVQRLRTIKPKKERIAGINGEIGGIYDTVEGFKVNKKAARIFLTLDGLEPDEQQDIWRSLMGLIDSAEWQKGDLVDEAEGGSGNIVTPDFSSGRKGKGGAKADASAPEAGEPRDMDEAMREVEEMEDEQGDAKPVSVDEQARRDAEFDAAAPKPESPAERRARMKAAAAPSSEPYTGDNSDLAGE